MVYSIQPEPFADAGRQRQYEAVRAALATGPAADTLVLLGNLEAGADLPVDALLLGPDCLVVLMLTPRSGRLSAPSFAYGSWQLDGQPLPGRYGTDNPFAQYREQLPTVLAWVAAQLGRDEAELPPCYGLALFEAPLTFASEVETQLHYYAGQDDFQLLGGAAQLGPRLAQLPAAPAPALPTHALQAWAEQLTAELSDEQLAAENPDPASYLTDQLRRLWRWLGAEDVPADPPYGGYLPATDQHLRDEQEQARLQQLRQELQAELQKQRQEAAAQELVRQQELALLRQQVAQASQAAGNQQTQAAEEALQQARTELADRSQELDTRIRQLKQLIARLQAAPPAAAPSGPNLGLSTLPAPTPRPVRPASQPASRLQLRRQAERWGVLALVVASLGAGTWGLVRLVQRSAPPPTAAAHRHVRNRLFASSPEPVPPVYIVDSSLAPPPVRADTTTILKASPSEAAPVVEPAPSAQPAADSARELPSSTPDTTEPGDSTVTSPSSTP